MKRLFCVLIAAAMLLALAACGKARQDEPENSGTETVQPAEVRDWSRSGYFQDENGNILSVTWMALNGVDDGWYIGAMLGGDLIEDSYGGMAVQEGNTLHAALSSAGENGNIAVTVAEEGEDGLTLTVEGGETFRFKPMETEEASIVVRVNVEGMGNIAYAEGETAPEIDPEYPYQSAQINLAEPAVHTLAAWADEGSYFVKWTKNGEDFSAEPTVTVNLDESADYVAVFDWDFFSGEYLDPETGESGLWIERNDDGTYAVRISILRLTNLDDGVGTVEDDELHFTATDANGNPISGVIVPGFECMDVTFTDSNWPLIESGTSFTYETENAALFRDDNNPVKPFVGEYQSDRAHAFVETFGSEDALIVIEWGGSAWSLGRWDMTGFVDPDTLTVEYSDCVSREVTYNDSGEEVGEEILYENGTGFVRFREDGTFTWHDDQSDREDLLFVPLPPEN